VTPAARLVVLASPGLGILDNWLPVLAAARERRPDLEIVVIVPERATLLDVDPADTVVRMTDRLIDGVVAPTVDGGLVRHADLSAARAAAGTERVAATALRLLAAAGRRIGRPVAPDRPPLRGVLRLLRPAALRRPDADLAALGGPSSRVCYDVYVHRKPAVRRVLTALGPTPRWSLHHGIDLVAPSPKDVASPEPHLEARASLYADAERSVYVERYGVPAERLRVDGVPRSDPAWAARIVAVSAERHATPRRGHVLVISRPAGSSYLPWERKVRALRDLHRVACDELGLRLVIKPHPKEGDDGSVAAALPADGEGVTWERSGAHPFHLAAGAHAAVAFHSGLVVDLVDLGVPVIELIDVRGLPEHDGPDAVRDEHGRPAFSAFRRAGMVLAAEGIDELRQHLGRIAEDREGVVAALRAARCRAFARVPDAVARIRDDLLAPWPRA
jgi:hypothetical protein